MRSQKRKLLAFVLAIVMIGACAPAAWAEDEKEVVVGSYYSNWVVLTGQEPEESGEGPEVPEELGELPQETIVRIVTQDPDGNVNLRAAPSIDSEVLALLQSGTEVVLLSQESGWMNVRHNELTGYVREDFVDTQIQAEPEQPKTVTISSNLGETVNYGDIIVLTGELAGFDDANYTMQWFAGNGDSWIELPGEQGIRYSYVLDETNIGSQYRLAVSVVEQAHS